MDTLPELAQRNAVNLAAKMAVVNEEKGLTRRVPSEPEITHWVEVGVEEARSLPRMLEY